VMSTPSTVGAGEAEMVQDIGWAVSPGRGSTRAKIKMTGR
jgi:hypothetical protein